MAIAKTARYLKSVEAAGSKRAGSSDRASALRQYLTAAEIQPQLPAEIDPAAIVRVLVAAPDKQEASALSLRKLAEAVREEIRRREQLLEVVTIKGTVVSLIGGALKDTAVEALARGIHHQARSGLMFKQLRLGVGRAFPAADGLRRSYREALWAIEVGEQRGDEGITHFKSLGIYRVLEPFLREPSDADVEEVMTLAAYDAENRTSLLPTLVACLESERCIDAAERLFVHRNTVAYRMSCIRRVIGLDLRDSEARLLLEVQLRLAKLRGMLPHIEVTTVAERKGPGRKSSRSRLAAVPS